MEPLVLEPLVLEMASHQILELLAMAMAGMLRKAPMAGVGAGAGAGHTALSVLKFFRLLLSNWEIAIWTQLRILQLQSHQPQGPVQFNLRSHHLQFNLRSHLRHNHLHRELLKLSQWQRNKQQVEAEQQPVAA